MLRQRLIQNRADHGDWRAAEDLCREALAASPDDPPFAWALISAQANQGHLDQAWSTYRQLHPLVTAPELIALWIALHARFGFTEPDVVAALDLIDKWSDNQDVGGQILTAFVELGSQHRPDGQPILPDLSPGTLSRFQAELKNYALRNPQTDTLVLREVSLAEHQNLYRRATILDEAARQLTVTDLTPAAGAPDPHQAWSAAITIAAAHRVPLWSDDVAVRSVAASQEVPAFGTYALLAALTEAGLIVDTRAEDTVTLAQAHVIHLPDTRR
jgi:hypothetical protein